MSELSIEESKNVLIGCHISDATPSPEEVNKAIIKLLKYQSEYEEFLKNGGME